MLNKNKLEEIFRNNDYHDFKWITTDQILVSQWVRFKCIFGCNAYGKGGACPPSVPSVQECREFIGGYKHAVIFHFEKVLQNPDERGQYSREINMKLLELEREVFLAGYHKAFLLFIDKCRICEECPGTRIDCKNLNSSRPGPESLGIDVFSTVRNVGYEIEVLTDFTQKMNRYAFLLVE